MKGMTETLRLNLGCGQQHLPGYVNVDKYGEPDLRWDLETFPWPWETNSVSQVLLNHVLEHLGQQTDVYFGIIQELYRVCRHGALIQIAVPHPRHDDFLTDPTHVRAITADGLRMFSKTLNREWARLGAANTPLGLYLNVDFEVVRAAHMLDEPWLSRHKAGDIRDTDIWQLARQYNNVIKQVEIDWRVVKEG